MPVPDLADPRPPYLQIADELRRQINSGRYQPGDKLPSNKAMAVDYRTSTETIRKALRALMDEGLVGSHSTLGTFVLRAAAEPEPDPDFVRLESALQDVLRRLGKLEERLTGLEKSS